MRINLLTYSHKLCPRQHWVLMLRILLSSLQRIAQPTIPGNLVYLSSQPTFISYQISTKQSLVFLEHKMLCFLSKPVRTCHFKGGRGSGWTPSPVLLQGGLSHSLPCTHVCTCKQALVFGEHMEIWREWDAWRERAMEVLLPFPILSLCISSIWLLLSYIFYNKLVTVSKVLLRAGVILVNY